MNQYVKPNLSLPFSLHDARISKILVISCKTGKSDGEITLQFDNGYKKISDSNMQHTDNAKIIFSGIDYDFCHVYYCKENERKEITFKELAEDIEKNALDIVDEAYGYNMTILGCTMVTSDSWHEVVIEIYHHNDTVYLWE